MTNLRRRTARGGALLLAAALFSCAGPAPAPPAALPAASPRVAMAPDRTPVCHTCFWNHQPDELRADFVRVMRQRQRRATDRFIAAEYALVVARVAEDSAAVCAAARQYAPLATTEANVDRRLLAQETLAFTAGPCGRDPAAAFRTAAATARAAGMRSKADVYDAIAADTLRPVVQRRNAPRRLVVPAGTRRFVLGASRIRVDSASVIVTQLERVARDWLSFQFLYDFQRAPDTTSILQYHEGARLFDVVAATDVRIRPVTGTLAVQIGDRWLAPDADGVFRLEVLADKVQYPTTRTWRGVALLVDTHGISAVAEAAARERADLVVGCGDSEGKMDAAAHLASLGIDVYFPTDRYVSEVLGYEGPGTLLGSAPVRREGRAAIIGDRPITFRVDEPIVVQRIGTSGVLQYYDAPGRYFGRLAQSLPLRLDYVIVDDAGQADRVVRRARALKATAIAARVWNEDDYRPVRDWLAESPAHRAVLFHTVAYPAGERLFAEFPRQTTFGDPRPVFLTR